MKSGFEGTNGTPRMNFHFSNFYMVRSITPKIAAQRQSFKVTGMATENGFISW